MTIAYMAEANALRDELVAHRRDFHQHPETAFEELRTASIVAQQLTSLGFEVQTQVGRTGVVGILEGASDGKTVLVRADMDALPMQEANQTEYTSKVDGKMHACGHDGHTAIGLGVAKLFARHRDKIHGRLKFVFQPAEEIGQGARAMIADGALENPRPDVSLGLHLWNTMPLGYLGVTEGAIMAGASVFKMTVTGKGGHGAIPNIAIDPIVCACQMVSAFQTIVSRNADPLDTAVVTVTQIHSGSASNVIPDTAYLNGTFRTYTPAMRDLITRRLQTIAEGVAMALNCTVTTEIHHATEPVVNHPRVVQRALNAFKRVGDYPVVEERTMGAEDVGEFMTDVPGMFFFLGSANPDRALDYPHHHPRFDFDEDVLPLGVALLSSVVGDYLLQP